MKMESKFELTQEQKYQAWYEQKITLSDPWYKLIIKMLKPVIPSFEGKRVLEVGCGLGVFCIHIAKQKGDVIGLDISKNAVKKGKDLTSKLGVKEKIEFIVGDARFLPIKDGCEDLIVCSETLEHLNNAEQAFHEFARIADNLGYICITVPNLISSLFFEYVFFMVMGQPKFVKRYLNVEKEHVFHYYKVKGLVNSERLFIVDIQGTDFVHLHPKITKVFRLNKLVSLVSNELENKKSWRFFGSNIGVIAKKAHSTKEQLVALN